MADFLNKGLNLFKISYFTLIYWGVGLTEEEYHIRKAHYWINLENHRRAIRNYQKALKASEDSYVRATMAWCYGEIGMTEACLEHYRRSYDRYQRPSVALRLAYAELNMDNHEESENLLSYVKDNKDKLDTADTEDIPRLEKYLLEKKKNLSKKAL